MVCAPAASGSVRRYSPARAASVGGPTAAHAARGRPPAAPRDPPAAPPPGPAATPAAPAKSSRRVAALPPRRRAGGPGACRPARDWGGGVPAEPGRGVAPARSWARPTAARSWLRHPKHSTPGLPTRAGVTPRPGDNPRAARALQPRALAARRRLQRVDLALQALDLRGFLRPRERVLAETERVARLARALIRVPQVLGDGWVVARQLDRALELLDGAPVVAALVVDPAEAVDVEAVVGLDLERAADEPLRLLELNAHLGVGVAEVVERGRVLGVELHGPLHLLDGARLVLGLVVGRAQREAVAVVVRVALDHALEERDRRLEILALAVERSQVAHQVGVVGLDLEGPLHFPHRVRELRRLLHQVGALDARVDVEVGAGRDLAELLEGAVDLLSLRVDRAQVVAHAPVLRLGRQHQVELLRRTVGIALLQVDEPDLGARLARIGVDLRPLLELRARLVELLLPDVESGQAAADDHAVRVERQDALVELDRLVGAALELVGEREVGQDELRLRVQLERFQVIALGL